MKDLHEVKNLDELLIYLNTLYPKYIDFDLKRIKKLLRKLNNPEKKISNVIHVAGTNGKGSTIAFINSIAKVYGLKVNTYISPHLINFNERIRLNGEIINNKLLFNTLFEVAKKNNGNKITFFEITTVACFLIFSKFPSDLCLIETGLGGRLDATNVLPSKKISAITKIGYDHEDFLGNDLKKITLEKCGIIKKNTPVVIGYQNKKGVKDIIIKNAIKKQSKIISLYKIPKNWKLGLDGIHQYENATIAVTALKQYFFDIDTKTIKKGLEKVSWDGRIQKINQGKLISKRKNLTLIDGAHNLDGALALSNHLKTLKPQKWTLIIGMLKNKNAEGFLKILRSQIDKVFTIPINDQNLIYKASEFKKITTKLKIKSHNYENLENALENVSKNDALLITGSLYLVGEFLKKN
jgi:dihydrofolate synthase/folylpolyglutamate synthase